LLLHDRECVSAYRELSSLYAEMGRGDAAIALLERAEATLPKNPDITFLLGMRLLQLEELDRAITCFKRLAGRKLPQVHFQTAVAYFYKGNLKLAEEQFRLTLQLDPHFPRINESIGELLLERNALTEAVAFLRRGIDADPYSAVSHFLLGSAYGKLHEWTSAHEEFVLAVDMDPTESQHWQQCGESLLHLKRYEEAEPYLRKALDLEPASVDVMLALCKALTMTGDLPGAQAIRAAAFTLDPAHARAGEARWKLRPAARRQTR
jgi:tetratricopeptide (TPR) repeat protein